jgi:hypothetical protein
VVAFCTPSTYQVQSEDRIAILAQHGAAAP